MFSILLENSPPLPSNLKLSSANILNLGSPKFFIWERVRTPYKQSINLLLCHSTLNHLTYSQHSLSRNWISRLSGYLKVKLESRIQLLLFSYKYYFLCGIGKPLDFAFIKLFTCVFGLESYIQVIQSTNQMTAHYGCLLSIIGKRCEYLCQCLNYYRFASKGVIV